MPDDTQVIAAQNLFRPTHQNGAAVAGLRVHQVTGFCHKFLAATGPSAGDAVALAHTGPDRAHGLGGISTEGGNLATF